MSETARVLTLLQGLGLGALGLALLLSRTRFGRLIRIPVALFTMIVCIAHIIILT